MGGNCLKLGKTSIKLQFMSDLHNTPTDSKKGNMRKLITAAIIIAGLAGAAYLYFFKTNVPDDLRSDFIKIPTGSTLENLRSQLITEGFILDENNFDQWANWLEFKNARSGRFKITKGWSSYDLIKHLQRGEQAPVKVVLNNERTPEQVAAKVAKFLEYDSARFAQAFLDSTLLDSLQMSRATLMCLFLPNTYEIFWNTEPRKFVERMSKEYKRFWNAERTAKARAQGMNPEQAVTMASIVNGESRHEDERPRVAAVYLNRFKQNMKLQADPTVQFALMEIEKTGTFRRLLNRDYLVAHPYNTYVYEGLPPGPICMPAPSSIEAVLNPEAHNYLYFCAKPDNSGYHNYAETYEQHLSFVKIYQNWLATRDK
jgi:UPF0755 protein